MENSFGVTTKWLYWIVLSMVLSIANSGSARAGDAEALAKFDLIGHWAVDCSQPPSPANPHTRFIVSDGWRPVYQVNFGNAASDAAWTIRDAHVISDDRFGLALSVGVVTFASIELRKLNGRIRSMESADGEGRQIIHEGVLVRTGQGSPWLEKCSGGATG